MQLREPAAMINCTVSWGCRAELRRVRPTVCLTPTQHLRATPLSWILDVVSMHTVTLRRQPAVSGKRRVALVGARAHSGPGKSSSTCRPQAALSIALRSSRPASSGSTPSSTSRAAASGDKFASHGSFYQVRHVRCKKPASQHGRTWGLRGAGHAACMCFAEYDAACKPRRCP